MRDIAERFHVAGGTEGILSRAVAFSTIALLKIEPTFRTKRN